MLESIEGKKVGDFTLLQFIGEGATAEVWSAKKENDQTEYALKLFSPKFSLDNFSKSLLEKEYEQTKKLKHKNIIAPLDYFELEGTPIIVMTLCRNSLWQEFRERKSRASQLSGNYKNLFTEQELSQVLSDLSLALNHVHKMGLVHHDVKPANVLMYEDPQSGETTYALSDFGITREIRETIVRQTNQMGNSSMTLAYASPERLRGELGNNPQSDMFSLGCTLFEMTNEMNMSLGTILNNGGQIPEINGYYSQRYKDIIYALLNKDTTRRLSSQDLAETCHFFRSNGFWPSLENQPEYKATPAPSTIRLDEQQLIEEQETPVHTLAHESRTKPLTQRYIPNVSAASNNRQSSLKKILAFGLPMLVVAGLIGWFVTQPSNPMDNNMAAIQSTYAKSMQWKDTDYFVVQDKQSKKVGIVDINNTVSYDFIYRYIQLKEAEDILILVKSKDDRDTISLTK